MSTATESKRSLDTTQRDWLKKMGAGLDMKVSAAPAAAPTSGAADPAAAPRGAHPLTVTVEPTE